MTLLPHATHSRAVLIGTSRYTHLTDLPAVANNLRALATALRGPASWQLADEHCTVIADPGDWTEVLHAVRKAAEEATDTLLVYFAGHGLLEETRGDLFLGLPHSQQGRSYTGVPYSALRDVMLAGRPQRHVVILDCCFSGRALGTMSGPGMIADHAEIEGSYLLAASPESSFALAPVGETYTAFTGELLRLLDEGVPDGPELLDLDTVYTALRAALRAKGRPLPQKRDRNTAGRLALSRNAARAEADHDTAPLAATTAPTARPTSNAAAEGEGDKPAAVEPASAGGPAAPAKKIWQRGTRGQRYAAGLVALSLIAGGITWYKNAGPDGPVVTLGYVNRDEGKAVAYLWQELLARRGYQPRLQAKTPGQLFAGQANGHIDIQANARMPSESAYLQRYASKLEDLGAWFEGTSLKVAVPSYVDDAETISDIKGKSAFDGWNSYYYSFARQPDSGEPSSCEEELTKEYGVEFQEPLSLDYPEHQPNELGVAYRAKTPTAVLLRSPHWEYAKYELTDLADPKDVLACSRADIHMVARKDFAKKRPQVAKWMKNFRLDTTQLSSLEYEIHKADEEHTRQAVRTWLTDHPGTAEKLAPPAAPEKTGTST
ncbi:glycine betaine ABC transporter substrate-binding protein [Streptomyces javensis]|uniref:caspase, EACC1-associated type n=1 Tax=Streptomyces javensis TaxID=114698 RepID=UPI0033D5F78E